MALVCVPVAAPVSVMVTFAVAVAVDVPGTYCTTIVQVPPGATAAPEMQVPPVMENVPPAAPTLVMTGFAVNVSGNVAAAALLTVMVPVFVVRSGVAVVKAGAGAEIAGVAPRTVKGSVLLAPIGVVTPRFLMPGAAPFAITQLAVTVVAVGVPVIVQVTPPPDTVTAVAPVRLAPLMVTGTVVPCNPELGTIEVIVAPCTVNGTELLTATAPGTVMVTLWTPSVAVAEMVKFTVAVVELPTTRPLGVTPAPETFTALAPVRLVPVSVTATVVARTPVGGAIVANVGVGGIVTVKVTALLVPPGAVTVTFLAVPPAPAAIVKVALTCPSLITEMPLTVTPPPDTGMAVVPVSPVPKRLTCVAMPRAADAGEIDVSTGPRTV